MGHVDPEARRAYAKRYREANLEAILERERLYRENNREAQRARCHDWYLRNREARHEYYLRRREEGGAELRAREWENAKRWRADNPEKRREHAGPAARARRARKKGATVEIVQSRVVFDRDNWTCQICGQPTEGEWPDPLSPSIDHIVALVNGGEHSYANIQCAHLRCNVAKWKS